MTKEELRDEIESVLNEVCADGMIKEHHIESILSLTTPNIEYWKEKAEHYSNKCDTLTNALMAKTTPTDLDLLDRLIEYMESRADADGDSEGIYPNEEMRLLNELESLREKLTEIKKEKNERRTKS
jgi:hypothetical protein